MIIVMSSGHVQKDQLEAYLTAMRDSGAVAATRSESGCIHYDLSASASGDGTVYITECWEGFPALQGHMRSANMEKMNEVNSRFGVTYSAKLYQAEPVG